MVDSSNRRRTARRNYVTGRVHWKMRQFVPLIAAVVVVAALAVAVLPDREPDSTFPVQVISTTVIQPDEVAKTVATATLTPTPDLITAVLTPAMITFDLPAPPHAKADSATGDHTNGHSDFRVRARR